MFTGKKFPLTLAFVVLVALAVGVSCKGFFPDSTLLSMAVGPANPSLDTGKNNIQQMTAVGTYNDGTRPDSKVTWSIVDLTGKNVATVSTSGKVTAANQGTATVTATSTEIPTIAGSTTVTVTVPCITSIDVEPSSPQNVVHGNSISYTATAITCNGKFDITDVATWTSSNTSAATIDSTGKATAVTAGQSTNITATAGGVTSNVAVLNVT